MNKALKKGACLIGIDEAGRGPLAGPVSVGAFAVKSHAMLTRFKGVKDSKQLSEEQREEWFAIIKKCSKEGDACYAVSFTGAATIDLKGISNSICAALNRCLKRLEAKGFGAVDSCVLLDGSLYAPVRYPDQTTIIDGDAKEPIIALASICAKVLRDRKMKRFAKEYPQYGFEIHKGYGTKAHYKAIRKHGISDLHRNSFLKKLKAAKRRII